MVTIDITNIFRKPDSIINSEILDCLFEKCNIEILSNLNNIKWLLNSDVISESVNDNINSHYNNFFNIVYEFKKSSEEIPNIEPDDEKTYDLSAMNKMVSDAIKEGLDIINKMIKNDNGIDDIGEDPYGNKVEAYLTKYKDIKKSDYFTNFHKNYDKIVLQNRYNDEYLKQIKGVKIDNNLSKTNKKYVAQILSTIARDISELVMATTKTEMQLRERAKKETNRDISNSPVISNVRGSLTPRSKVKKFVLK